MKMANIKFKKWTNLPSSVQLKYTLDFKEWYEKNIAEKTFYCCNIDTEGAVEIKVVPLRKPSSVAESHFFSREWFEEEVSGQEQFTAAPIPTISAKRERLDVMLDIESLSTEPNGVLIQISAIPFQIEGDSPFASGQTWNEFISPKSCIEAGLEVNADTMKWWFKQEDHIQHRVLGKAISEGGKLTFVLDTFSNWLKSLEEKAEKVFIWGYPATSDMAWLQNAYKAAKLPYPVAYNRTRCLGTLADLYWERTGLKLSEQSKTQINHDALQDCKAQIEMVQIAYKTLAWKEV